MGDQILPRAPRNRRDKSGRRYRLDLTDIVYDDGAHSWSAYFRTKWFAYLYAYYKYYISSYTAGSVVLIDQEKE